MDSTTVRKVCVVIPCYNEEKRLPENSFREFVGKEENAAIHFCFVNDGSTDETATLLDRLKNEKRDNISVVNMPENSGKAEAVRQGMLQVLKQGDFQAVGYFDADLATPLDEIQRLKSHLFDQPDRLMVCGSRVKLLGRDIKRKFFRHYAGRVFATLVSLILKLPVYDTQCGAKMMKLELAEMVFAEKFISRWLFDVEIFARICKSSLNPVSVISEVPLLEWNEVGESKVSLWAMVNVPKDLFRIKREYRL